MGKLVDIDEVIRVAKDTFPKEDVRKIMWVLCYTPTAYDVEKVVAELEEAKEKIAKEDYCRTKHYIENDCEHKDCFKCCAEYLIDIVKRGGVE